ncbi:MAG: vitamin K epoxide reductase family protein [Anaerolineaceae bacterium]|nr:vitamin K epoxide reductase family protein [Anaerolineaceae bacterium]
MNIALLVVTIIGLLDSGYLSIVKLANTLPYCTPGLGECQTVALSQWAYVLDIPVAYLGFLSYLGIFVLLVFGKKIKFVAPYVDYLLFFISLVGVLFSAYLTYIEAFVLHAWCQWCVISAITMAVIFVLCVRKLVNRQQ